MDTPRSFFLKIGSLNLHALNWGREGVGKHVLLLHGLSSTSRVWELVAPFLARSNLYVTALDLRGHGQSDDFEGDLEFEDLSADIAGVLDVGGLERPIVVGHSWGAILALDYAARYADSQSDPGGIALIDGGIAQFDDYPGATWPWVREALRPPQLEGLTVEDFSARLRAPSRKWQPDQRAFDIILSAFHVSPQGTISPRLPHERYMQAVRKIWEFRAYDKFAQVGCPVLMLPVRPPEPNGRRDQVYIAMKERGIERARSVISDLHCHWMEDAVHDVLLQKPPDLAEQIISFAESVAGEEKQDRAKRRGHMPIMNSKPATMWAIRQATRDDQAGIRRLIYASRLNPFGLDWSRFLIAEDSDGVLIGSGQIKVHGDGSRELASLAVKAGWRGQGIGGAILARLIEDARPPVWLTCRSGLISLYERFGFEAVGQEEAQPPYFARIRRLVSVLSIFSDSGERLAVMVRRGK